MTVARCDCFVSNCPVFLTSAAFLGNTIKKFVKWDSFAVYVELSYCLCALE